MSDTKIVIDKDDFEQKIIGWIERRDYVTKSDILALFKDLTTEIQIDQSIEERAKNKALKYSYANEYQYEKIVKAMIESATQQQIIEQLKVKEIVERNEYFVSEIKRRQQLIDSEPQGIVRDTMLGNLFTGLI